MKNLLWLVLLLPRPAEAARLLKVLSYNVAGIPIVHAHWPQRRRAIGERLWEGGYDLVALQETWLDRDALALAEASGLPYYTRYPRHLTMGTGLAILSRYPIIEKRELPFTCRPSALRWMQGESVANKGVLMVRVATPQGPLDVYTAHPVAAYPDAKYATLRWTQLYELAEMVAEHSKDRPFLILGDLNTAPGEGEYRLLVDLLGLDDACLVNGKDHCGPTNEADAARIDHILVPRGPGRVGPARTVFRGTIPGTRVPYSDHLGLEADIDTRFLSRKLMPDHHARSAALSALEARLARMMGAMTKRLETRNWLPVYGFLILTRYEYQIRQLASIAARAESARLRLLHARP